MKRSIILATLVATLGTGAAYASDPLGCNVPRADWQPPEMLRAQLEAEGYQVRQIKEENGCYEVYAIGPKGNRAENVYNPATLTMIGSEGGSDDNGEDMDD